MFKIFRRKEENKYKGVQLEYTISRMKYQIEGLYLLLEQDKKGIMKLSNSHKRKLHKKLEEYESEYKELTGNSYE
jgi:hypothetical protein